MVGIESNILNSFLLMNVRVRTNGDIQIGEKLFRSKRLEVVKSLDQPHSERSWHIKGDIQDCLTYIGI